MRNLLNTLQWAGKKRVAVPHFNIAGYEQFKAVAETARELDLPVLIGVSEGERKYLGVKQVHDLLTSYNEEYGDKENDGGFWLFLNADHTHDPALAKEAASAGFDEVLFDGGKLPLDEDIKQTGEVVKMLKSINPALVVEGEMGYIGSDSEMWDKIPEGAALSPDALTKPEDAARFVSETRVDMLAPAVGNVHGMFRGGHDPRLDIQRIKAIKDATKVPLVLHGGSGTVDEDFTAAIDAGITIVHISTEIRVAWRKGVERGLEEKPDEVAPYKIMPAAIEGMKAVIGARMKLFYKQ
jgi:fructose-bisphosphate aldolase class II